MRLSKASVIPVLAVLVCGSISRAGDPDDSLLTLYVSTGRVTLGTGEQDARALRDKGPEAGVLLECREIRLSTGPAKAIQLDCLDATFLTASGIRGCAPQLRYDSSRGAITLTGTSKRPVELQSGFDAEDRPSARISAERVMIDLPRSQAMIVGARALVSPGSWRAMILGTRAFVRSWREDPPPSSKPCVSGGCDVPGAPGYRPADLSPRE